MPPVPESYRSKKKSSNGHQETVPPVEHRWREFLTPNPVYELRDGHIQMFEWAATADFSEDICTRKTMAVITGYGKTLIAYGVFEILKKRGIVNRCLVLTPGDDQRTQFMEDCYDDARRLLGCTTKACICTGQDHEFKSNRSGEYDLFVATYQQLKDNVGRYFSKLLLYGDWMMDSDEYHHLAEGNKWTTRSEDLPAKVRLFMSVGPQRTKGVVRIAPAPSVNVSYKDAYWQQAVRLVKGFDDTYTLRYLSKGKVHEVTTKQLLKLPKDQLENFSNYEKQKQLRYDRNYIDFMLMDPVEKLLELRARDGKQHQMLVFAMSCAHASWVSDSIKELVSGYLTCDWVGISENVSGESKNDNENKRAIKSFRKGELDILVQVNKCAEGFSMKTASVLLFLNLLKSEERILQQIGRGIRRNQAIPFDNDVCYIYSSSDSVVARMVQKMEADVRDVPELVAKKPRNRDSMSLHQIPVVSRLSVEYTSTDRVMPNGITVGGTIDPTLLGAYRVIAEKKGMSVEQVIEVINNVKGSKTPRATEQQLPKDRKSAVDKVTAARTILVHNIVKILKVNGRDTDTPTLGKLHKGVNGQWIRISGMSHTEMTIEELERKRDWIAEVNQELLSTKELPSWVWEVLRK